MILTKAKRAHSPRVQKFSEDRLFFYYNIQFYAFKGQKYPYKAIKNAELTQIIVSYSAFLFGGEGEI